MALISSRADYNVISGNRHIYTEEGLLNPNNTNNIAKDKTLLKIRKLSTPPSGGAARGMVRYSEILVFDYMNLSRGNFLAVFAGGAVTLSCGGSAKSAGPTDRYELTGEVVRWDPASRLALIRHEDIKSAEGKVWMAGMTMEFPVKEPADIAKMKPGLRIKASLLQRPKDFEYWIAEIQEQPAPNANP